MRQITISSLSESASMVTAACDNRVCAASPDVKLPGCRSIAQPFARTCRTAAPFKWNAASASVILVTAQCWVFRVLSSVLASSASLSASQIIKNSSGPSHTTWRSPAEENLFAAVGNAQPMTDLTCVLADLLARRFNLPRCTISENTRPGLLLSGLAPLGLAWRVAGLPARALRPGNRLALLDVLAIDALSFWIKKHCINHFRLDHAAIKQWKKYRLAVQIMSTL